MNNTTYEVTGEKGEFPTYAAAVSAFTRKKHLYPGRHITITKVTGGSREIVKESVQSLDD